MRLDSAVHDRPLDDHLADHLIDAGLAIARATTGLTCIALPVPLVASAAIIAAWRAAPVVAWSHGDTALVGVGIARELRGTGPERFAQIVAQARQLEVTATVGHRAWTPRLFGGAAFAEGGADLAPWAGFGDAWFALPRWTLGGGWLVLAVDAREAKQDARWRDELAAFRVAIAKGFAARPQPAMTRLDPGDTERWRAYVQAITEAIARGECEKVVAARNVLVELAGEARPADLFAELDARHPELARVLVRPPNAGTLIAATPERLVELDGLTVRCDALAGSLARRDARDRDTIDPPGDAAALLASAKDRNEHALVVSAITDTLRGLGAEVEAPAQPGIRTLRDVLHLHTPISARLHERRHVLELAAALHPTPAMGGTPTRVAQRWIAEREAARGWYAAPVGWFDLEGNGELAVAIRSGVVEGPRAHLYAGSGIVAGSDPDRELAETDVKLRAMLGALGVRA
ncbi:MAG: isochorismate synthase [Kofleriaceae bacterium]